jgi:hypothetical protein
MEFKSPTNDLIMVEEEETKDGTKIKLNSWSFFFHYSSLLIPKEKLKSKDHIITFG